MNTECRRGHVRTPENTDTRYGRVRCMTCYRDHDRRRARLRNIRSRKGGYTPCAPAPNLLPDDPREALAHVLREVNDPEVFTLFRELVLAG